MDRGLTGRDVFGRGEWDFGTWAEHADYMAAVLPKLTSSEKARLARELIEITGNRSQRLSDRIGAAAAITFHGRELGLKGSVTTARALERIIQAEFLGGTEGRKKHLVQASFLRLNLKSTRFLFLLLLLAAETTVHLKKGRRLALWLASLAAGTELGSRLTSALMAGNLAPPPAPLDRRRRRRK